MKHRKRHYIEAIVPNAKENDIVTVL